MPETGQQRIGDADDPETAEVRADHHEPEPWENLDEAFDFELEMDRLDDRNEFEPTDEELEGHTDGLESEPFPQADWRKGMH